MDIKILENVGSDDRSGKLEKPSPPGYSKEDYGQFCSSQEWKSGAAAHDRSGKPEKTSWDIMQQVAPHREEPLLDGNAHSVRYGEMIHDGSGKLEKLNHQEEAILKISSWAVTQQNLWTKLITKCETDRKECRTLLCQVKSIQ